MMNKDREKRHDAVAKLQKLAIGSIIPLIGLLVSISTWLKSGSTNFIAGGMIWFFIIACTTMKLVYEKKQRQVLAYFEEESTSPGTF